MGRGSLIEAKPRGQVLIRHADGVDVVGEVLDIDSPKRVAFGYGFLNRSAKLSGDSRVTINLEPLGRTTRLHLSHEFNDPAARDEDHLVAHTAAYQRFFPGIRFERRGDLRHCEGVVLADWITHADEGTGRLNGTCCFTLNTMNQIEAAINFIRQK